MGKSSRYVLAALLLAGVAPAGCEALSAQKKREAEAAHRNAVATVRRVVADRLPTLTAEELARVFSTPPDTGNYDLGGPNDHRFSWEIGGGRRVVGEYSGYLSKLTAGAVRVRVALREHAD